MRGRRERRVEWLLSRGWWASIILLRSCRGTNRWRLGESRGCRWRGLGVGGWWWCSRVCGTGSRLGAVRWS